ncbi:cysteine dioxygenase family protein [Couchioplanes caeruleus]|uniref:cysteine dioxygenase n=1 Tax=Couchioplanes caeruleus TaxID=56438 RepID=UPI0020C1319B|nr:cysteine dioxygenase family protein [Couchioplanes caeruleus]UQU64533.1 cysteine dioxygenase family protein [Couchioplanes caeruleus]
MTVADLRLDHLALAQRFAADPRVWPVAPRFDASARWYHRLAEADDHEIWLLTWLPGQGTDLHDHGGSAGAFHVFSGTLTEDTVSIAPDSPPRITARELGEGAGRRFGSRHIHRITNRSNRPAISIHAYAPALRTMTRYRIGASGLDVVTVEQAGAQW